MSLRIFVVCLILLSLLFVNSCGLKPIHINTPATPPPAAKLTNIKIALVLGGGGARGATHAGVLSVLEEHNIPIDLIVGTSAGSIVGALYADNPDSNLLRKKLLKLNKWDLLDPNLNSGAKMFWKVSGIIDGHALRGFLQNNLHHQDFRNLPIPLAVVTTDLEAGKVFVIRSGAIVPAVHASCAVPLVFSPVELYGKTLVDGGVMSPVPVDVARQLGAKHIIAVDISDTIEEAKITSTYQLADRSLWLSSYALSNWQTHHADILIQPKLKNSGLFDDSQLGKYYQLGRQAALNALPDIKNLID